MNSVHFNCELHFILHPIVMRYLTEEHNEITVDGERSTAEKVRDRWKIQVKDKLLDKFLDKFSDKSKTLNESY